MDLNIYSDVDQNHVHQAYSLVNNNYYRANTNRGEVFCEALYLIYNDNSIYLVNGDKELICILGLFKNNEGQEWWVGDSTFYGKPILIALTITQNNGVLNLYGIDGDTYYSLDKEDFINYLHSFYHLHIPNRAA